MDHGPWFIYIRKLSYLKEQRIDSEPRIDLKKLLCVPSLSGCPDFMTF